MCVRERERERKERGGEREQIFESVCGWVFDRVIACAGKWLVCV